MKLKVVSFNIRCANDKNGHSIAERAPRLASAITPLEPDVIGLQEYNPKWEDYIDRYFGENYEIFNKYRSVETPESAPILWRKNKFKCIDKGYFWLSDTPDVESRGWDEVYHCHRICEYIILEAKENGVRFCVMNTHYGFGDAGQIKSGELIHARSQEISDYPTIIIGDFNLTTDAPGYAVLTEYFTDVNAVTRHDHSTTYHGYFPEQHLDSRIDFCFISNGITPIDQRNICTTFDGKYPSDHYGLEIDVDVLESSTMLSNDTNE